MNRIRVIPLLLIHKGGLVKSVKFKNYKYIGDPINAVKIFNEKEIDEIVVLDIDASRDNRVPDFESIKEIAGEAFIPLAYGGGITTIEEIKKLFYLGVEKVILNTSAFKNHKLITDAASLVGSQSVMVSIDVKKNFFGKYIVCINNGKNLISLSPVDYAIKMEAAGAGEILLTSIDNDGTYKGYDTALIKIVASAVDIPVIASGGAGSMEDFVEAKKAGASAVSAGSMFVFQRPHQAVLISYPSQKELKEKLYSKI